MLAVFYTMESCTLKIEPRCALRFLLFGKSEKVLMTDSLLEFVTFVIYFSTNHEHSCAKSKLDFLPTMIPHSVGL